MELTLPGFMMSSGSMAFLIVHMSSTVSSPSSAMRYSFLPTPTPCSPVPVEAVESTVDHNARNKWSLTCSV